jgi:broad specificity phosphatase PhoE
MAELILVRHAETAWSGRRFCGRTDLPLTDVGKATAERLGLELAGSLSAIVRIVASPLHRARETAAAIVAAGAADEYTVDDRWAETDFGAAEGLAWDELVRVFPDVSARLLEGDALIDWPGGEPAAALQARVQAAWNELIERPESVVVVSHGGPLRIAIALATEVAAASVAVPDPGAVWRWNRDPVLRFPA